MREVVELHEVLGGGTVTVVTVVEVERVVSSRLPMPTMPQAWLGLMPPVVQRASHCWWNALRKVSLKVYHVR